MIVHGYKIIDQTLAWFVVSDHVGEIETFDGIVDSDFKLISEISVGTETLQVHDKNIRHLPQLVCLLGTTMFFTTRAIPRVLF